MILALPKAYQFACLKIQGDDAFDFAQRILATDIKSLGKEFRFTPLLNANAKVLCSFWIAKTTNGLRLLAHQQDIDLLHQQIEIYHFAEAIEISREEGVSSGWRYGDEALEKGSSYSSESEAILHWGRLSFVLGFQQEAAKDSRPSKDEDFGLARMSELYPDRLLDQTDQHNVFEFGFEKFCAQNKGCYIGQEVVERVVSRGGKSPQKFCCLELSSQPSGSNTVYDESQQKVGILHEPALRAKGDKWRVCGYLKTSFLNEMTPARLENQPEALEILAV